MPRNWGKTKKVWLPGLNQIASFSDRKAMKVGEPTVLLKMPAKLPIPLKLPIDWAKNLVFPIDGNDIYGSCMLAAGEHADNTFTGNNGTESTFSEDGTVSFYLALSGGDNGLNTGDILNAWLNGLQGATGAKIMDAVSIDTTNAELVQTAIWLFGGVFFSLSIPDSWYGPFVTGEVWDAPATPDSSNGHAVWWNGVDKNGRYKFQTWGSYGWITPAGVADCDPSGFVVFSQRWFDSNWKAPNGYTYDQLAALWSEMGGHPIPSIPATPKSPNSLLAKEGVLMGGVVKSPDGRFKLNLQTDGNLVLHGPAEQPLWATGTNGHGDAFELVMQADGNLVLYNGQSQPLWAAGTNGNSGAYLLVQNDGNVVVYDAGKKPLWSTKTVTPAMPTASTKSGLLLSGQGLAAGAALKSADGRFTLNMQTDGNLVLHGPGDQPLWATGTNGHYNVWDATMQTDGNFVVHDAQGQPLWATGTNGNAGATLSVQNDGNLVVHSAGNQPLWASNTVTPAMPTAPTKSGELLSGQGIAAGTALKSPDGRFKLNLQTDGNLVLHGPADQPLWATGTNGHYNVWDATMQTDGNFVVHDAQAAPLWATGTNGNGGATLSVQNDGNVVVYGTGHQPLWASNTVAVAEPKGSTAAGQLLAGEGLAVGGALTSTDGKNKLRMQTDSNLVIYDEYDQPLWSTGTNGALGIWDVTMQTDGNLVVHDLHGKPLWASGTNGNPGATLTMQTDGNLVIHDTKNNPIWASNTEIGVEVLTH